MSNQNDFFVAGGTLRPQTPSYVTRPADQELFESVRSDKFCYVLTSRQMGKSSLMVRTTRRLSEVGIAIVIIDLTSIGSASIDAWYIGLLKRIESNLRLDLSVEEWWQARQAISVPQRFTEFLHDVVLARTTAKVAIFIDEIDATLPLKFRDDFFAAIRAMYNARANDSIYNRLTFVLLGVATPTDLIQDRERTPFNIGQRIVLQEFSEDDAQPLLQGLEEIHPGWGERILSRIFYWTNGHPYLTQKLCLASTQMERQEWSDQDVDDLVETSFFTREARKDGNLTFVQNRILSSPSVERRRMLKLYRQVYDAKAVHDDDRSLTQKHLELSNLIGVDQGKLCVRNRIYQHVFDQNWIKDHTPANSHLVITIAAGVVAILLIAFTIYSALRPVPQPLVEVCVDRFIKNAVPEVRLEALECLFEQSADDQARMLFYETLNSTQQKYLFLSVTSQTDTQVGVVVKGIYLALDAKIRNDRDLMDAMIVALQASQQLGADTLIEEIESWKAGGQFTEQRQYHQAVDKYSQAIRINDVNPAARFDRALAYIEIGKYIEAIADLDQVLSQTYVSPCVDAPLTSVTPVSPTTQRFINCARVKAAIGETIARSEGIQASLKVGRYPRLIAALLEIETDGADVDAFHTIILAKFEEPNPFLRQRGSQALRQLAVASPEIVTPEIIEGLFQLLADEDNGVAMSARAAMVRVVEANVEGRALAASLLAQQLVEADERVRNRGLEALTKVAANQEFAQQLTVELGDELDSQDTDIRFRAITAIGQVVTANAGVITQPLIDALIGRLIDQEDRIRSVAASILGQAVAAVPQIAPQVAEALAQRLTDVDSSVRAHATAAIGQVVTANAKVATRPLAEALVERLTDTDSGVRARAAETLPQVAAANPDLANELTAILQTVLSDQNSEVRGLAVEALGKMTRTNTALATFDLLANLVPLLQDVDSAVRSRTVVALGNLAAANPALATSELVAILRPLLQDPDTSVRSSTLATLGQIVSTAPVATEVRDALLPLLQDSDSGVRTQVTDLLGKIVMVNPAVATQELSEGLAELLVDPDSGVRAGAAQAIGRVVEVNSVVITPPIVESLVGLLSDLDGNVRAAATEALGLAATPVTPATNSQDAALIAALLDKSYQSRGDGYHSDWTFHQYSLSQGLGFPIGKLGWIEVGGVSYIYQAFARDTLYIEIGKQHDVRQLSVLLTDQVPADGLARVLLDATYRDGGTTFQPDQPLHVYALTARLGPPIGELSILTIDGVEYNVQVYTLDTIFNPVSNLANIQQVSGLSQATEQSQILLRDALLTETYLRSGAGYYPEWAFHLKARRNNLGAPLSWNDRDRISIDGASYAFQVYATDTVYNLIPRWNEVRLLNELIKPPA